MNLLAKADLFYPLGSPNHGSRAMIVHIQFSGWADIAYSYLIGGDGVVYEGRGQFWIPATAYG